MKWLDMGLVVFTQPHGENGMILKALTREHGLHAGMIRSRKKNLPICQAGNIVQLNWNARIEEHLGTFQCESARCYSHDVMHNILTAYGLTSLTALLTRTLPERYPCPDIYDSAVTLIEHMCSSETWLEEYVKFELNLLAWLGYGLDLDQCAATGATVSLHYVSPKSGRAVCQASGEPYKDKLLKLPAFLATPETTHTAKNHTNSSTIEEIIDGIKLTRYFLDKYIFVPQQRTIPMSCQIFANKLMHSTLPLAQEA